MLITVESVQDQCVFFCCLFEARVGTRNLNSEQSHKYIGISSSTRNLIPPLLKKASPLFHILVGDNRQSIMSLFIQGGLQILLEVGYDNTTENYFPVVFKRDNSQFRYTESH